MINVFILVVSRSILHVNSSVMYQNLCSKSVLVLSECNDLYFIAIAFIAFTLYIIHEIKQCPLFRTPGILGFGVRRICMCNAPY